MHLGYDNFMTFDEWSKSVVLAEELVEDFVLPKDAPPIAKAISNKSLELWACVEEKGSCLFLTNEVEPETGNKQRVVGYTLATPKKAFSDNVAVILRVKILCSYCKGFGSLRDFWDGPLVRCLYCDGSKRIFIEQPTWDNLTTFAIERNDRIRRGKL